jgi:hypothetical protein
VAIAIVQGWGGGSGKVTSYTCPSSGSALTANNWLLYFVNCAYGGDAITVASEASGNGISISAGQAAASPQINSSYYYAWAVRITAGGAVSNLTVQNPVSGGQYYTVSGVEVSGVTGLVTSTGTVDATYPTSHPGTALTGLVAATAVICGFGDVANSGTETYTAGSGFTLLTAATFLGSSNTYNPAGVQYKLSTSGTQACPWTSTLNVQSSTIAIALTGAAIVSGNQAMMMQGVG